jgi:hypothetical protein
MATANYGIWTPTGTTQMTPIQTPFVTLANSVDTALVTIADKMPAQQVSSQAERAALYPTPVQGDSVYRLDRGWVERYYGAYNATSNPGGKPLAGWYGDSGTIIRSVRDTWPDMTVDADTSTSPFVMRRVAIADPGIPYRIQGYGQVEAGAWAAGTRWDLQLAVTEPGSTTLLEHLGAYSGAETVSSQTVVSLPSTTTFTGNKDLILRLDRVYGASNGRLSRFNHRFQYTLYAA